MEYVELYQKTKKTYNELKEQHAEMLIVTKKLTEEFHQTYEPRHGDIGEAYQQTYDGWKKASDNVEKLLGPLQQQLEELQHTIKEIYGIEL